jgi:type II secretory pathway pseudopilin PulG
MRRWRMLGRFIGGESGVTFMETVVALAILGVIAVTFLNGLTTTSKTVFLTDEQVTAESLAQSQIEWVKSANYSYGATTYSPAPIPSGKDYLDYSALIKAESLRDPDDGIQKITVTIRRSDKGVLRLEGYKVDR